MEAERAGESRELFPCVGRRRVEREIGAKLLGEFAPLGDRIEATTRAPMALAASTPLDPIGPRPQTPKALAPLRRSFLHALNSVPKASVDIAAAT